MKATALLCTTLLIAPTLAAAQTPAAGAERPLLTPAAQIKAAVAPLPEQFRDGATVYGYETRGGALRELRRGDGPYICLADDVRQERFHVACYHESLEPFMARGRALREEGITGNQVDTVRYDEVLAGTLPMPSHPAALYSLTGGDVDPETGAITGARPLYVVYIPFATAESTGLPTTPVPNAPWLMSPGTPKAHIMFVPQM
jgi:hypothetical protein